MARMFIDCRKYPSEKNCTVSIAADWKPPCSMLSPCSHTDGPQLREMIGQAIQQESAGAPPDIAARDVKPAACHQKASAGTMMPAHSPRHLTAKGATA